MSVSILEVCKKAHVSRMTVSRVIRGHDSVSPETQKKVMKAICELGYVPSANARAMRSKDILIANGSLCCALVFGSDTKGSESFFSNVARAAEQEAAKNGLCLLQSHWQDSFETSWPRLKSVFAVSGMCGVVLAGQFSGEEVNAIQKFTKNIVTLDGPAPVGTKLASVESDNVGGSILAVQHLISKGVARILVITGPTPNHYFAKAMVLGIKNFANQLKKYETVYTEPTAHAGYEIIKKMFSKGVPFDGVFCNDELAIGVLRALAELKINVPKEVKVIGFDDVVHAAYLKPALTTVSVDKTQLGREAVNTLVEIVRGRQDLANLKKTLCAELIVRESA
jgi:LacI family transcriptional regulator